ncbi:hypothetical protein HaLaN_28028 [Haematococcus lacustris]|uniref:Uncharacterized protein n=1 Tax=Haematococcus lacustris TaxID=44745 RepID=A0A6A0AAQ1_HAELA|nr:hypothetical protein HaLaN_28028 [Haematococcus lacustris]
MGGKKIGWVWAIGWKDGYGPHKQRMGLGVEPLRAQAGAGPSLTSAASALAGSAVRGLHAFWKQLLGWLDEVRAKDWRGGLRLEVWQPGLAPALHSGRPLWWRQWSPEAGSLGLPGLLLGAPLTEQPACTGTGQLGVKNGWVGRAATPGRVRQAGVAGQPFCWPPAAWWPAALGTAGQGWAAQQPGLRCTWRTSMNSRHESLRVGADVVRQSMGAVPVS